MKQFVLTLGIALLTTVTFAQKSANTKAYFAIQEAIEFMQKDIAKAGEKAMEAKKYTDAAMEHSDTKDGAKTLWYNGKIYFTLGQIIMASDDKTQFGGLSAEKAIEQGMNSFKREKEVDTKGRYSGDVDNYLSAMYAPMREQGVASYTDGDFKVAAGGLLGAAHIGEIVGFVDSSAYYFGSLAAYQAEMYEPATEGFKKCVEMGYLRGENVVNIAKIHNIQGDSAKADAYLAEAFTKYPNDIQLLVNGVDYYASSDRNEEAEKLITTAVALDPTNTVFVFNSGIIYEKIGKFAEAEAAYRKTLELDPNHTDAKLSLGILFFNMGADANNAANKLSLGDPAYDKLMQDAKDHWAAARPFLEQTLETRPEDLIALETLKNVYYKLKMTDEFRATKAKIDAIKAK